MKVHVRKSATSDAPHLAAIYNHYIEHTIVSFEQEPIDEAEMLSRMEKVWADGRWIIAEIDGRVAGYAYSAPWNSRCSYAKTREVSVYLDKDFTGRGIGKHLYQDLIDDAYKQEYHSLIGGISLPNEASVGLHEHFGFKKSAHYTEVGFKFNKWIDVGYWQLML